MNTDLCVDCKNSCTSSGTSVIVQEFYGTKNQFITVAGKRGDGQFKLRFGHTCKLIEGGRNRALIWRDNGANHQWLKITVVDDAPY